MTDKISIIVPVYNVKTYIEECIESIIQQSYQNLEIILIDDGSNDGSGEICDTYGRKDPRIKVLHKENGGVSSARNKGLEIASGDYIGFVDSDDVCKKNMYEKMLEVYKNDSSIDFCYCDIFQDGKVDSRGENGVIDKSSKMKLVFPFGASLWNGLFKKNKLKDIFFDESYFYGEDLLFLIRYLKNIEGRIYHLKCPLYSYRTNENSITNDENEEKMKIKYKNFILSSKATYNEIKSSEMYESVYSKKYIDLIFHVCQKIKNIDFKDTIFRELRDHKKNFSIKHKIYYYMIMININSLYYMKKIIKK